MAVPQQSGFLWGAGGQKLSAVDVARNRQVAEALARSGENPQTFWEGMQSLTGDVGSALLNHRADEAEKGGRQMVADALLKAQQGSDPNAFISVLGNEFASPAQSAVAQALLQRQWAQEDRSAASAEPDWQTFESGGDVFRYNRNDPESTPTLFHDGPDGGTRKYEKDANGVNRYLDTGEPVFPEMEGYEPPKEFGGDQFDTETKLRTEYQGQQGYKDFSSQERAYQRVLDSASNPSPAGDLALIFNYMKILDPGSVVRESEFATAAQSGSYGDQIQAAVNRVVSGERLSDGMRKDFVNRAGQLFKGAADIHSGMNQRYSGLAEQYGIEPDKIIREAERIGVLDPAFDVDQLLQIVTDQPVQLKPETADQEYDALPSGAEFIAPDGTRRRKP